MQIIIYLWLIDHISQFFFFQDNPCQHPLFFMKDTSYVDMAAVIEFVYKGEVNVLQSQLGSFLKTAEMLQVKGLSGDEDEDQVSYSQSLFYGWNIWAERCMMSMPEMTSKHLKQIFADFVMVLSNKQA